MEHKDSVEAAVEADVMLLLVLSLVVLIKVVMVVQVALLLDIK